MAGLLQGWCLKPREADPLSRSARWPAPLLKIANTSPSALDTTTATETLLGALREEFGGLTFKDPPVSRVLLEKSSLFRRQAAFNDTCDQLVDGVHHLVISSLGDSWNTQKGLSEKQTGRRGAWEDQN